MGGGRREQRDQLVERPLRIEHHRRQLALDLDVRAAEPVHVHELGPVAERIEPERLRQPASGVDRDQRHPPSSGGKPERDRCRHCRLAHAARAGTDDYALARERAIQAVHGSSRPADRRAVRCVPAELRFEQKRQRDAGHSLQLADQPLELSVLRLRTSMEPPSAADGRIVGRRREREPVFGAEPRRQHPVDHHRADLDAEPLGQGCLQPDGLGHRHLLGRRHHHGPDVGLVGQRTLDPGRLPRRRPHASDPAERARRRQQAHQLTARRRVQDHQVIGMRVRRVPRALAELPHLADRQQIAHAGRGFDEQLECATAGKHRGRDRSRHLPAKVLLQCTATFDRDVMQPRQELDFGQRITSGAAEQGRNVARGRRSRRRAREVRSAPRPRRAPPRRSTSRPRPCRRRSGSACRSAALSPLLPPAASAPADVAPF